MSERLAFVFHHKFCLKSKVDLEDAEITPEIRQKLTHLQQKYDDIISKHSNDIEHMHLERVPIDTDLNLPPVPCKPYPLPLKHKFAKEEIENLLEAELIERSISLYAIPIKVVTRKSRPGAPLAETKRLVN